VIKSAAYMLATSGLRDLGYVYVNIDDCWAMQEGRGPAGQLIPDPIRFPSGISGLAEYIHALGLKLGLYSDAGTNTCQGQPGSLGYEDIDANTFAAWGVDYLKYDNCNNQSIAAPTRYVAMRNALLSVPRPIFYSICTWGTEFVTSWGPFVGNSWRTGLDIKDEWSSIKENLKSNSEHPGVAGPGGWNDPDMLIVGKGGMTDVEYRTHFTMWALVKAPLIISCDLTRMSPSIYAILSNPEIIAINQDPKGQQGTCKCYCTWYDTVLRPQIWSAQLGNGDTAVIAFNIEDGPTRDYDIRLWGLGLFGSYEARDLWEHLDLGIVSKLMFVSAIERHGVRAYRLHQVDSLSVE
jgi:alpha-galactosidase